jgi:acyl-CoA reductase-like NAD-dependent aldehyde dehydrogenase
MLFRSRSNYIVHARQILSLGSPVSRHLSSSSSDIVFKERYGLFIDGKFTSTTGNEDSFAVEAPATGAHICDVVSADTAAVDAAVTAAQRSFDSGIWSRIDVRERAKVLNAIAALLRENIPELADMEVAQTGRAKREMRAQLARLPEWFEYFAALVRTHEGSVPPFLGDYINYVTRVPLGVVAQLTPWNHPMLIAIKKIAPALATGNSIVLKPSELAPVSVLQLAELCSRAGLPDGVLNVIPGLGPAAGQALCSHPLVRKVDLTGGS